MAKSTTYYTSPKPLRSRGYGKLLGLTLIAILGGIGLMAYEIFFEYKEMKAKQPGSYKVEPLPPPGKPAAVPNPNPNPNPNPPVVPGG